MVTLEVKRSRRDASCCNVEVVKGAAGRRRYGLSSKDVTANSACSNPPANDLAEASSRCTTSALDLSWPSARGRVPPPGGWQPSRRARQPGRGRLCATAPGKSRSHKVDRGHVASLVHRPSRYRFPGHLLAHV